jgi:hypothetical protein
MSETDTQLQGQVSRDGGVLAIAYPLGYVSLCNYIWQWTEQFSTEE